MINLLNRGLVVFLLFVLTMSCSSSAPPDDVDGDKALLAIVVTSMATSADTATFEVSLANISSSTLKITGVMVNPGVPRPAQGVPTASTFTLEPGQERMVLAEMRSIAGMRSSQDASLDWPDQVAVDIAMEHDGKRDSRTYRVNVQPHR